MPDIHVKNSMGVLGEIVLTDRTRVYFFSPSQLKRANETKRI